jgi:cell wall-associated NlpC family hydrolase
MKNIPLFLGLIVLVAFTTACTPRYKQAQRPQHHYAPPVARYNPPAPPRRQYTPPQRKYIPPVQQQYSHQANYSPTIQARQSIVRLAYQELGTRYKYGGSNPREGFDCSGLMTYVYKNGAGIKIPRTAAQQQNKSRTVRYAEIQPGDMLFFKTSSKSNHVGIYIGNRQFIHAPNRRSKVKITTMDNSYWHSKFVKFGTFLEG